MTKPPMEEVEQRAVAQYLDLLGILWCHCPNGGHRNKVSAGKMKAQGQKPGVPDILIFSPPPINPTAKGVAIELKRIKGGTLSPDQKRWLSDLSDIGWITKRCNGSGEAIDFLRELGY